MPHRCYVLPFLAVLVAVAVALLLPQPVQAATIQVTTSADEDGTNPLACSLREAIRSANDDADVGGCLGWACTPPIRSPSPPSPTARRSS